jgi:hypothetical protein
MTVQEFFGEMESFHSSFQSGVLFSIKALIPSAASFVGMTKRFDCARLESELESLAQAPTGSWIFDISEPPAAVFLKII